MLLRHSTPAHLVFLRACMHVKFTLKIVFLPLNFVIRHPSIHLWQLANVKCELCCSVFTQTLTGEDVEFFCCATTPKRLYNDVQAQSNHEQIYEHEEGFWNKMETQETCKKAMQEERVTTLSSHQPHHHHHHLWVIILFIIKGD